LLRWLYDYGTLEMDMYRGDDSTARDSAYAELARRELCKRSLIHFFREFWPITETADLSLNWAIELMADHLEALGNRELGQWNHTLSIQIPPRHSKSSLCTIAFPLWQWLRRPGELYMHASHNTRLAIDHAQKRRLILESPQYVALSGIKPKSQNSKTSLTNGKGGLSYIVPKNKATGSSCSILIVDDLHATTDSPIEIESAVNTYKNGLKNRLIQLDSCKLIPNQRVSEADVSAFAERTGCLVLKIPAIAPDVRRYHFMKGDRQIEVPADTLIDPTRMTDTLENLQLDPQTWATQYLQEPAPPTGLVFDPTCFGHEVEGISYDWCVISCDTASTTKEYSARWAFTIWKFSDYRGLIHLEHVSADRYEYLGGKNHLKFLLAHYRPQTVLIEDKSTGTSLLSDLPYDLGTTCPKLIPIKVTQGKVQRAARAQEIASLSNLTLNHSAPWAAEYLNELRLFPNGRYADCVDSTVQFLIWLKTSEIHKKKRGSILFN
jgi:predicted phage terminase large subunit-like protein